MSADFLTLRRRVGCFNLCNTSERSVVVHVTAEINGERREFSTWLGEEGGRFDVDENLTPAEVAEQWGRRLATLWINSSRKEDEANLAWLTTNMRALTVLHARTNAIAAQVRAARAAAAARDAVLDLEQAIIDMEEAP